MIGILIMAHDRLGDGLAEAVTHVLGAKPPHFDVFPVAATDDPARSQFTLAIADYPEIAQAIQTGEPVLLDDATTHPLTASVADKILRRGVKGIAVFPVTWRGRATCRCFSARPSPTACAHAGTCRRRVSASSSADR